MNANRPMQSFNKERGPRGFIFDQEICCILLIDVSPGALHLIEARVVFDGDRVGLRFGRVGVGLRFDVLVDVVDVLVDVR